MEIIIIVRYYFIHFNKFISFILLSLFSVVGQYIPNPHFNPMITEGRYVASFIVSISLLIVSIITCSLIKLHPTPNAPNTREDDIASSFFIVLFLSNVTQFTILVVHVSTSYCGNHFCSTSLFFYSEIMIFCFFVCTLGTFFEDTPPPPHSIILECIFVLLYIASIVVMLKFKIEPNSLKFWAVF